MGEGAQANEGKNRRSGRGPSAGVSHALALPCVFVSFCLRGSLYMYSSIFVPFRWGRPPAWTSAPGDMGRTTGNIREECAGSQK